MGGPGGILESCGERTRRAESRLGEPTKQNEGERRAWVGRQSVKRSCARGNKGQMDGTAPNGNHELEWIGVGDEERLRENYNRYGNAGAGEVCVESPKSVGTRRVWA